jgi:hypothetical protein
MSALTTNRYFQRQTKKLEINIPVQELPAHQWGNCRAA